MLRIRKKKPAFTFIEVSLASLVFIIILIAVLMLYISAIELTDLSYNMTKAQFAAQKIMEEIRNHSFYDIYADYSNYTFDPEGFASGEAKGVVYTVKEDGRDDFTRVNVVVCFRRGGRVIGEDANLNGNRDSGEDVNSSGFLDSPVEITALLTPR